MKKIDYRTLDIKPHNILVAYTTEPDYEMSRYILLEIEYDKYVILEGHHCSCFGFDDTEWKSIEYTQDELRKLANAGYNQDNPFWMLVRKHV